jgi:molybdopterin synthase catalytic subunit
MEREIRIFENALAETGDTDRPDTGEIGAVVRFEGRVRRIEEGRDVDGLDYTAYRPMAERELGKILDEIADRFRVDRVIVEHGTGAIPVGGLSLVVKVYAAHRQDALAACGYLIDRLKETVPIWKRGYT